MIVESEFLSRNKLPERKGFVREKFGFEGGLDPEVDGSIARRREGTEKERASEAGRGRAIDPTRSALLPHTRANPLVFGFSGKTARVKGRPGSNSRLNRGFSDVCGASRGCLFESACPSPRPFATRVTRSLSRQAGQV